MKKTWRYALLLGLFIFVSACSEKPELKTDTVFLEYGENPIKDLSLDTIIKDYEMLDDRYTFTIRVKSGEHDIMIDENSVLEVGAYRLEIYYQEGAQPLRLMMRIKDPVDEN